MAFPFSELDTVDILHFQECVTKAFTIQDALGQDQRTRKCEAILICLRHLYTKHNVKFDDKMFMDCLSLDGETILLASSFMFDQLYGIELSQSSMETALTRLENFSEIKDKIKFRVGSFQDYFLCNADVVFIDCTIIGPYLDEGCLLYSFYSCCRSLLPGSYVIILTRLDQIDTVDTNLELILHAQVCNGSSEEAFMWLFKTLKP
eukprot:gene644-1244_t